MIVHLEDYVLDVEPAAARAYCTAHSLCACDLCRNFYRQARGALPKLAALLDSLGVMIERPDEIGACEEGDAIDYYFVAYSVPGKILQSSAYEIDLRDGGQALNIVIDHDSVPNEQRAKDYFTITVFGVHLPQTAGGEKG